MEDEKTIELREWKRRMLRAFIKAIVDEKNVLSPRENKILSMRFGLDEYDGKTHTLEEVGRDFSVTRERIRQIETLAFQRIRKIIVSVGLVDDPKNQEPRVESEEPYNPYPSITATK